MWLLRIGCLAATLASGIDRGKSLVEISGVNMNRVLLFCFLLSAAAPHAQADDTWHNIYHSLKRFFTGNDRRSHATAQSRHQAVRHSHTRTNSEKSDVSSSEPRVIVLPEATPAKSEHADRPADKTSPEAAPTPNSSPVLRSMPALT
jgi:hypothetical protein